MKTEGQQDRLSKSFTGQSLNWLTIQPHTVAGNTLAGWFEGESGACVIVLPVPYAEITDKAIHDVSSGSGQYDIIQFWYPMLPTLIKAGVLTDITAWWEQNSPVFKGDDFVPVFRDTFCVSASRRYGVPFDGDMHLLFYNKILFNKYGLQPPKTWAEYLEISKKISLAEMDSGVYGCGIMAANIPLILIGTFLNRLAGFGGDFFDAQGNPTIDSPEALAALENLLATLPYSVPDPTKVAFDEMIGPWLSGKVGMVEFWADLGKMTDNPEQSAIPHQWGVAPLPKGPGPKGKTAAPLNAGWSLGISTRTQHPELALEFLKYTLDPQVQLRICTINGGLDPVRWSTYDLEAYQQFVSGELAGAAKAAVMSAAVPWPANARWAELQEILNDNLYLALTKVKAPQQALADTQAAWIKILK